MRRFQFRLQSVLEWRLVQLDLEEAKLQVLFGERRRIDATIESLTAGRIEAERAVAFAATVEAEQLYALEAHKRYVARETARLREERTGCEKRIAAQRERVLKAERDLRLLERLKQHRWTEWETAFNREQGVFVAEAFLSRWHRQE